MRVGHRMTGERTANRWSRRSFSFSASKARDLPRRRTFLSAAIPPQKNDFTERAMQYTTLGTTGMTVSRICLGCMSYGNPKWRPWVLDEQAAQPFFRAAIDAGINFFDTADMYSRGLSLPRSCRARK